MRPPDTRTLGGRQWRTRDGSLTCLVWLGKTKKRYPTLSHGDQPRVGEVIWIQFLFRTNRCHRVSRDEARRILK